MGCCAAFDCRCGGTQCRVRRYACADTKGARVPGESDRRTRDRSRRASCRNRYSTACIYRSRPSLLPSVVLPRTFRCCVHRCGHDSSYPRRTRIRLISATLYRDGHFNRNGSGSDGIQRQYGQSGSARQNKRKEDLIEDGGDAFARQRLQRHERFVPKEFEWQTSCALRQPIGIDLASLHRSRQHAFDDRPPFFDQSKPQLGRALNRPGFRSYRFPCPAVAGEADPRSA